MANFYEVSLKYTLTQAEVQRLQFKLLAGCARAVYRTDDLNKARSYALSQRNAVKNRLEIRNLETNEYYTF